MTLRVNNFRAAISIFINRKKTSRTASLIVAENYLVLTKLYLEYNVSHSEFGGTCLETDIQGKYSPPQPLQMKNG